MTKKETIDLRKIKADAESLVEKKEEDLVSREESFSIEYVAPTGKQFRADLLSCVMDTESRLAMNRVLQSLCMGVVFENLPTEEKYRLQGLARSLVQLKDPPEWLTEWIGQDNQLLIQILNTLVEHESLFFGASTKEGQEAKGQRRISITTKFITRSN
jgi:hypothetical protein